MLSPIAAIRRPLLEFAECAARSRPALPKKSMRSIAARRCRYPSSIRVIDGARPLPGRRLLVVRWSDRSMSRARTAYASWRDRPELLHERVVRPGVGGRADEDLGVAACRLDLGGEPLEILACVGSVWQHVEGLLAGSRRTAAAVSTSGLVGSKRSPAAGERTTASAADSGSWSARVAGAGADALRWVTILFTR